MELSTVVPVVACNTTKDINTTITRMVSNKYDFDIKTNITHVATRKRSLQFACHIPSTKKGGPDFTLK